MLSEGMNDPAVSPVETVAEYVGESNAGGLLVVAARITVTLVVLGCTCVT